MFPPDRRRKMASMSTRADNGAERGFHWRRAHPPAREFLVARFISHRFPRHTHEGFGICIIEEGVHRIKIRGRNECVPRTRVVTLNPDEPHDGESAVPGEGYAFRSLYLDTSDIPGWENRPGAPPRFIDAIVEDPDLSRELALAHRLCEPGDAVDTLTADTALERATAKLFERYARGLPPRPAGREATLVARARDWLSDNMERNVGLEELAQVVDLGRFRLLRAFERETGLPPHAWLIQARVARARDLLRAGLPPAEVAAAVGFHDQAHLTRRFHALVGVTPGRFAAEARRGRV